MNNSPHQQPGTRRLALRAPAKVNLHLEVLRQRPDGYHEIETVLQTVALFDHLRVTLVRTQAGGVPLIELLVRPHGRVPDDETNLCWRAARLFCETQRVSGHLQIELDKEIPVGAGLGGGSSDAMAVLVACDRLFGTALDTPAFVAMGARLGSDVPFFHRGATALGRGRGYDLTALPTIRAGYFLILKPRLELATREVYLGLKMGLTVRSAVANIQVIKPLIARFPTGSWFGSNRLEEVVLPSHPELQRALFKLRELAPVAMLTGSGSAIYGVFPDARQAEESVSMLGTDFAFARCVAPHPAGVQVLEG